MPTYDYRCFDCKADREVFRWMRQRDESVFCDCGAEMTRILRKAPGLGIWNPHRKFPISATSDDGIAFESRKAYNAYLDEHHMAEVATDAPSRKAKGVVFYKNYGRI